MTVKSRTGFITPEQFEELWTQFETKARSVDPDAFHIKGGEERYTAPVDGLKDLLREVSFQRKSMT